MRELESTGFRQFVGQLEGKHFGKEHFPSKVFFLKNLSDFKFFI